ncbi:MAG: Uma2 family endonuclease [Chloroflexota bacterium]
MVTLAPRRSFTATEYHQMGEAGIFWGAGRTELIIGEIVEMSAVGALHVNCVIALERVLHELVDRDVEVSIQNPVLLRFDTEPEPDAVLLPANRDRQSIPKAEDVLLLMEVSDSLLAYDRGTKLPLYAAAGIAEAWIVDVTGKTIERHTEPRDGHYDRVVRVGPGGKLASTTMPTITIDVDTILA